ncbi:hypothetical protein M8A51_11280 [Schlegelella sp. S2-27]|uniref:Uncharacterized protein n=1 Tax=Caldimonas mangrovi TaxID=2944811 RepID=A0ABT0YN32_9BURK|nr:hypothetical protein [Caldimonas mangrovi]MCM5680115.1 hypothetical protein [Caldimonas mangrovi]
MTLPSAEVEFIQMFVKPTLRDRWLHQLDSPKRRSKQLQRLHHGFYFEARSMEHVKHHAAHRADFIAMLRRYGAGGPVHVISAHSSRDGNAYSFEEAIDPNEGVARSHSTICIYSPKSLAVFADEYDRYVLWNGAA